MRILINGAGIAGPALAYWLRRGGQEVVLVERAEGLRGGGYVIDFWGLGYELAERMGVISRIRGLGYQVREVRFVDRGGGRCGGFSTGVFSRLTGDRFTSVRRADVAASVYGALEGKVETLFGDSVAGLEETGRGVNVRFERADSREVDLVVGADGLHSRVRRLMFGPDDGCEVSLGYHVAAFEIDGYRPRDELVYVSHGVAGRQVSRFSLRDDKTLFLFVFRDEFLSDAFRSRQEPPDDDACKQALGKVFGDVGWECPQILAALREAPELYFDRVSQVRLERWTKGRAALIGDAAACVSLLAGEGTGLAMTEAYVLAGELCDCGGDYTAAFARYEARLRPFLKKKQESAARFATSFAPKTNWGIGFRNFVTKFLNIPQVADYFIGRGLGDDFVLPEYGF